MKYQYKVKNFRIFDEDGVKLDMAPITILTGCNSSGKSSFVKSMLLVNKVLNKLSQDGKLRTGIKLDFTEKPNNLLGAFDSIIHRGSESKNITVEYTVPSLLLNEDVVVAMTFNRHWKLNGGVLNEISISRLDGSVLFEEKPEEHDYRSSKTTCCADLRDSFLRYVFAKNNVLFINNILDGNLYKIAERRDDSDAFMKKVKKVTESVEPYYNANKEWIDKILSRTISHSLVPHIKNQADGLMNDVKLGITNEQIYKDNLLYSPILDSLFEAKKETFESQAKSIADEEKNSDLYDYALCYIEAVAKSFKDSEFDNFSDYFNHLYNGFFCNGIEIDDTVAPGVYESLSSYNQFAGQAISPDMLKDFCGDDPLGDLYNLIKLLTGLSNSETFNEIYSIESPNWYRTYFDYIKLVIKEILSYRIPTEISYIPTSIVNIKRLYSFDEKDDLTELFKDYILSEPEYGEDGTWGFASRWLKKLNIGKKVSVKALADGAGCEVRIYKDNDDKGQLLADFGYGVSQLIFLLLRIEIEANRRHPIMNGTSDMDYEEKDERNFRLQFEKPLTIVLEEPEVHLHPKLQSAIADILLDAYKYFNFHFIVETHSEYLIRKTQVLVAQMGFESNVESVEKSPFVTYYIPENSKPYSLGYRKDGKFMESFGTGFYDEASNLAFELL